MMSNREIRHFAWRQLKGNWSVAVGASLLSTLCLMVLVVLMAGGYLLALLGGALAISRTAAAADLRFVLPVVGIVMAAMLFLLIYLAAGFSLGALRLNLRIARGEKVRARDIFAGFADFLQLRHFAGVYILLNLGSVALNFPISIVSAIYGSGSANAHITSLVCNALAIVYAFFMSMSTLASAEDRNRGAVRSMQVSCRLMRCRKLRLLGLYLSFIPWLALSMVTFGIGYLFTIPYLSVAQAIFFLSAYSEEFLTSAQEADYREVPEDNVGDSDAGVAPEAAEAPETWPEEDAAPKMAAQAEIDECAETEPSVSTDGNAPSAEDVAVAEPAAAEPSTLAPETAPHESPAAEVNADGAPEENKPEEKPASARRSFEEVYREVVLSGRQAEADSREKGEES